MRGLALTKENIDSERHAVKEEQRFRVDNQPYAPSEIELENISYDNFAYKHPIIGSMDDLDRASVKDFKDFFAGYYSPSNAVLTLVGDFEPEDALAKIRKYFGALPNHPTPPGPILHEEPHLGQRRETVEDPLARLPKFFAVFLIPPGNTEDNYALQLLGAVLAEGRSSRLYRHLVKEKQLATSVDAGPTTRMGPSLFYLIATPKPGVSMSKIEEAMFEEVEALKKAPITQEELDRAQRQNVMDQVQQRDTSLELAYRIGEDAVVFGDAALVNKVIDKFNAVTPEQARQAAAKYLVAKESVVIDVMPIAAPAGTKEARP